MTWHSCRLGDVMTLSRGHDLPESQRKEGSVPIVSSSGITGYHDLAKAKAPGVVTGRYGTLGEVFYLDEDYWPLNTALYVKDFKGNNPRYVAYLLQHVLRNYQSDKAAVPGVDRNVLHELMVPSTDLNSQQRIVEILSAYDDLIENNMRRMALLERVSQELYREWFVRLRFPGSEHVSIKEGVPEGWHIRPLSGCVTFRSGGTPNKQRSEYWDGAIPWVSSGQMTATRLYDTSLHISPEAAERQSALVPTDTILVVVRGMSLAKEFRVAVTTRPMAFNQDLKALVCESDIDPAFMTHALLEQRGYIRDLASEASHGTKKLDVSVLERLPILVPDPQLQKEFREVVAVFTSQRDNLHSQNEKLGVAREVVMPRLISGQLIK